jgi:hypothetical protein
MKSVLLSSLRRGDKVQVFRRGDEPYSGVNVVSIKHKDAERSIFRNSENLGKTFRLNTDVIRDNIL